MIKDAQLSVWRKDFPILNRKVNGKNLIYLDNGASSQKPIQVIDAISNYYLHGHSNVHRGVHTLSQEATEIFEKTRSLTKAFINAQYTEEIIYTSGTTESINLVAYSFGEKFINKGDEIVITEMEHHSNLVPWQLLCDKKEAKLVVAPIKENGTLDLISFKALLNSKTRLVAITHVSNTLGTVNPIDEIINAAKGVGAFTLIDGAQSAPHLQIDVQALGCDFYTFSGHKMYGPTGTGILYGKRELLEQMPPYKAGGEMIKTVTYQKTSFNELPFKFEAGTPNIAGMVGLGAAIQYINEIGIEAIAKHEESLLAYATEQLKTKVDNVRIIGEASHKASLVSFLVSNHHPYDIGSILDQLGIAVRTGHHCTEPLMNRLQIPGTVRASFAFYNTFEEIDTLIEGVNRAKSILD